MPNVKRIEGGGKNGMEPKQVYEFVCAHMPNSGGFGLYKSWVHVDVRSNKARWKK